MALPLTAGQEGRATPTESPEPSHWLVFLSASGKRNPGIETSQLPDPHGEIAADFLFTHSQGAARVLVETEISNDDTVIDRIQLGWEMTPNTVLWAGKFHLPVSSWNFGQDHGHYLQTAITVPSVEQWDDDAGLLPQSALGFLLETQQEVGKSAGLQFSLGFGAIPNPKRAAADERYWQPFFSTRHQPSSTSARAAFLPDFLGDRSIGVLFARHKPSLKNLSESLRRESDSVVETVYGLFADWHVEKFRLLTTIYYIDLAFAGQTPLPSEHLTAGYMQIERKVPADVTLYARHDNASKSKTSRYVAEFGDEFAVRRNCIGLRWDFSKSQALSFEAARASTLFRRFSELRLQWSAVIR